MRSATQPHTSGPRPVVLLVGTFLLTMAFLTLPLRGPVAARAAVARPAFPRLAIWWPDASRQPLASLAQCDWIALRSEDAGRIADLRGLNPNIVVLGPTAAREVNYSLGDYDSPLNVELRSASTDWMLTQVGSTLTSGITASTTSIPVADVTKFAVGEMVLVDRELMRVEAIGSSGLTVMARGPVNPPASHAAGARIASVVTHWHDSIAMDLTTSCPKRDVGHGPETWSDWNVRRGQSVLQSADWDGLLIDGLEGNVSWLATNGENRSIDLMRTNIPVTDGYASFNTAWNAGAEAYGNALRAACGDKILIGNGNMRDYDFNGTVFEEFPYSTLRPSWWDYIFVGPYDYPRASYPEWIASAAAPNLTTVQTYGASNDYQLMRFGLCSALMNDGYFSYALSSAGHAVNGIYWYDEYDNAGAGRGYLGQPTGSATRVGNAWRRDYANGIALVNPTTAAVTVQLGGTFRKINGTQAPIGQRRKRCHGRHPAAARRHRPVADQPECGSRRRPAGLEHRDRIRSGNHSASHRRAGVGRLRSHRAADSRGALVAIGRDTDDRSGRLGPSVTHTGRDDRVPCRSSRHRRRFKLAEGRRTTTSGAQGLEEERVEGRPSRVQRHGQPSGPCHGQPAALYGWQMEDREAAQDSLRALLHQGRLLEARILLLPGLRPGRQESLRCEERHRPSLGPVGSRRAARIPGPAGGVEEP